MTDSLDKTQKVSQGGFVTVNAEGLIQHWNLATNKCVNQIKEESGCGLNALDYSPDGRMFAVGGSDTHVYLYDETTKQRISSMHPGPHLPGHSNRVFSVKFHPDDANILVSGGWDRTL